MKHGKAPQDKIVSYFERWAAKVADKDVHRTIERLLGGLSEEYEKEGDVVFALDEAEQFFNAVRLERLRESLGSCLDKGEVIGALKDVSGFSPLDLRAPPATDVLTDTYAWEKALEGKAKPLVSYPGPAGEFFGTELAEDSFVAFMARAKGGKSYTLLDLAWRAVRQGNNTAYFQVGDLSKDQILRRFIRRAVYRPLVAKSYRYPTGILLPGGGRDPAVVDFEERSHEEDVSVAETGRAFKKFADKTQGRLRLSQHATRSVSVEGIRDVLSRWDDGGWRPSVVVVDYAGNLAPVEYKLPKHEQVDHTWALLRQLSETRKCLVVTAQQSNKEGFRAWALTMSNFRDSLMILAHVTAFWGVNWTEEERQNGVVRYNCLASRENEFLESHCLHCASCIDVANPIVTSVLPDRR